MRVGENRVVVGREGGGTRKEEGSVGPMYCEGEKEGRRCTEVGESSLGVRENHHCI